MELSTKPLRYYAEISVETILDELKSSEKGLSEKDAEKRLRLYGANILIEEKRSHWIIEYLSNFKNPLVLILLFAALTSFILRDIVDSIIITIIVFVSTFLNFFQEFSAGKAAEKLKERVANEASVIRNGQQQEIKVKSLCVGDIITLSAGDMVPADARIIAAKDFFVNQSALTGESFPVEKDQETLDKTKKVENEKEDREILSLRNIIFSGSNVTTGTATAVIIKTGKETEFGKIGTSISQETQPSEFTLGIKNLSYYILRTTIFFVLFVFVINTFYKHTSVLESFTFAVALAVGLTPELLPIIMSINMARGSLLMAKKGAVVKRLTAIPNFGSMDVLCTDKTGTLTEAHIELIKYIDVFGEHSETVFLHAYLNSYFHTGLKNPMDDAVVRYKHEDVKHYEKIDEIPFDFVRRKTSIVVQRDRELFLITKGAPEDIFSSSAYVQKGDKKESLTAGEKTKIKKLYEDLNADGFRVLGVAIKKLETKKKIYTTDDENDMILLGFIAFLDPAKKDVKEVLSRIKSMGIEAKVITGDSELTTEKICRDVGLEIKGILLGRDIEGVSDDSLRIKVDQTTVFARFSPEQKNRVIHALKKNNHVVGYMGDGINDAPSLKAADVGISVNNAVDVAKESADIILTHKSLKELEEGVIEGRKTFGNTMKYIMMGISSNFGNMFSVLGAVLYLPFLPMLSVQILLNNLLYDVSQISLPTDSVDKEYILSPKRWNMKFITRFMIVFGTISSIFDFLTFYVLYSVFHVSQHALQTGWFLESLATQTLVIYVIRTRKIPFIQSSPSKYLILTTLAVVTIGWLIPLLPLGGFFSFALPPFQAILAIDLIIIFYLLSVEAAKRVFYRRYSL